jgi:hypothetical protein
VVLDITTVGRLSNRCYTPYPFTGKCIVQHQGGSSHHGCLSWKKTCEKNFLAVRAGQTLDKQTGRDGDDTMDPNHLRQAIDAEIESLKESIRESVRALRQRRNALAPISSLPTEIIDDILLRVGANRGNSGLAWLRVAHVCRLWREIALNQPLFWRHINFTNVTLAGAAEMLARAKNAPLHLEATITHWDFNRYDPFVKELQAHVSHIRHLSIIGTTFLFYRILPYDESSDSQIGKLASPAPALEFLSLSQVDPNIDILYLPDTLFHGITPRLSFLELHNINISWKSPFLKGLKYLKLHETKICDRPSLAEWLDALDNMSQLKQLHLILASPTATAYPFDIERTVTLPFLTHLYISSTANDCALSLAHLVLPALTSLWLTAKSASINGSDLLDLLPYVTKHADGPQDTQPLRSVLFRSEGACIQIAAWPMPDIYADDLPWFAMTKLTPRVALYLRCKWTHTGDPGVLDAAMEALPLDNLVTLTAQHDTPLDDELIWLRHAPRWPHLEHVRLATRAARGLREMLLEDNGGRERPVLPSLTKLALIEGTALSARRTLRLCDALKRRVRKGVPLKVLYLRACRATSSAVERLGEIVDNVQGPIHWEEEEYDAVWDSETLGHFVRDDDSEGSQSEMEGS